MLQMLYSVQHVLTNRALVQQWMEWHPVGKFLLAGNTAGAVLMWDVPAGNMSYFSGHTVCICASRVGVVAARRDRLLCGGHCVLSFASPRLTSGRRVVRAVGSVRKIFHHWQRRRHAPYLEPQDAGDYTESRW
jgi:hypothetical protein